MSTLFKQALIFQWLNIGQFALFKQHIPNYGISFSSLVYTIFWEVLLWPLSCLYELSVDLYLYYTGLYKTGTNWLEVHAQEIGH